MCDADFDALATLLTSHSDLRVWFLVDSLARLALIEGWATRCDVLAPFDVLLEMGMLGQRTGCHTLEEALHLAQALAASAGGSAVFDLLLPLLLHMQGLAHPMLGVLRSGCYITHDHGNYPTICALF